MNDVELCRKRKKEKEKKRIVNREKEIEENGQN